MGQSEPYIRTEQPVPVKPSELTTVKEIEQALENWVAAVNSGSIDTILGLYDPNAILLPTLSSQSRKTQDERKDYFNFFTSRQGLKGHITEANIQVFGTSAIASGFYTFSFLDNGKKVAVPARFTFVYKKSSKDWLIVNHHSSELPKG